MTDIMRALVLTVAAGVSATTSAQNGTPEWRNVVEPPIEGAAPLTMAMVANQAGDSLKIFKDENDIIHGIFTLGDEMESLEERACPTVRVDQLPPHPLLQLSGPCDREDSHHVRFTLGVVNEGQIQSTMLWQLINGGGFRVWYQLKERGYGEALFSLRRSMNALVGALGTEVEVVP